MIQIVSSEVGVKLLAASGAALKETSVVFSAPTGRAQKVSMLQKGESVEIFLADLKDLCDFGGFQSAACSLRGGKLHGLGGMDYV